MRYTTLPCAAARCVMGLLIDIRRSIDVNGLGLLIRPQIGLCTCGVYSPRSGTGTVSHGFGKNSNPVAA